MWELFSILRTPDVAIILRCLVRLIVTKYDCTGFDRVNSWSEAQMKWIIVVFVNFLPDTQQWEMFDYRDRHFSSQTACELYVMENKQFFIDEANKAFQRNSKDCVILCPSLEKFKRNMTDKIHQKA